jgi:hypothetical protein
MFPALPVETEENHAPGQPVGGFIFETGTFQLQVWRVAVAPARNTRNAFESFVKKKKNPEKCPIVGH